MLFSYVSGHQQIDDNKKCRQIAGNFDCHAYDSGHIAQWGAFMASCEATRCHHLASGCATHPRRPPCSLILNETHKTLTKNNF